MSVKIRSAVKADAKEITALAARLANFEIPGWRTPEEIIDADALAMLRAIDEARSDSEVFVAEVGGVPVGCLHIVLTEDFFGRRHAHISVVAVSEEAEGTGAGRALMTFAEDWGRQLGVPFITLNVFAANAHARRFYEKAGYGAEAIKYAKPI